MTVALMILLASLAVLGILGTLRALSMDGLHREPRVSLAEQEERRVASLL